MKKEKSKQITLLLIYIFFMFLLTAVTLGPIYILFVNTSRSTEEIAQGISLIPSKYLLSNWKLLSSRGAFNVVTGFFNSMTISSGFTFLSIYFGTMAAYGLHVYNFKGNKALFMIILGVLMIPAQLTTIGYYKYMSSIKLTNTLYSLILPGLYHPTTVFFMKQYAKSIVPFDLISAARIDGASEFGIFHKIAIPMLAPGMATMAIFAFVMSWNNFMLPNIMLTSAGKYTLPLMVQLLKGDAFRVEYGALYLGIALSVLPIITVYIIFSRFIIGGVMKGGINE